MLCCRLIRHHFLLFFIAFFIIQLLQAQLSPDYKGGFVFKLDDDGKKVMGISTWGQFQTIYENKVPEDVNHFTFNLRRARLNSYFKINDDFLIVTQIGLNNLNSQNLSPSGEGDGSQIRLHDFYGQYNLNKEHSIGAGLHFFNGISRLNSFSATSSLALDNNRQSWATLGLSDQIGRHLGIYAKGYFGKFTYRVSVNDVEKNGLDQRTPEVNGPSVYGGRRILGSKEAGFSYGGYFEYCFKEMETSMLAFKTGTYLGSKEVFNIGAGFYLHPNGAVISDEPGIYIGEDVKIYALDAFYDKPIGQNGAALTAYAVLQNQDYGRDYLFLAYSTGSMFYTHWGYLFPGKEDQLRFQPYAHFAINKVDATPENRNKYGIGINALLSGKNLKFTLEYLHEDWINSNDFVTLQAQIVL
ncbi:MAG: hypothetical protein WBN16_03055 [Lutimonas sp.]